MPTTLERVKIASLEIGAKTNQNHGAGPLQLQEDDANTRDEKYILHIYLPSLNTAVEDIGAACRASKLM